MTVKSTYAILAFCLSLMCVGVNECGTRLPWGCPPECAGLNLTQANMNGEHLSGANLSGADLSSAKLRQADLGGADLRGASLFSADLTEAAEEPTEEHS